MPGGECSETVSTLSFTVPVHSTGQYPVDSGLTRQYSGPGQYRWTVELILNSGQYPDLELGTVPELTQDSTRVTGWKRNRRVQLRRRSIAVHHHSRTGLRPRSPAFRAAMFIITDRCWMNAGLGRALVSASAA